MQAQKLFWTPVRAARSTVRDTSTVLELESVLAVQRLNLNLPGSHLGFETGKPMTSESGRDLVVVHEGKLVGDQHE